MLEDESTLLQAARDFQQTMPSPALDAAVLSAAAKHAAEIRKPCAEPANPIPPTLSPFKRLSHWLFGNSQKRGHLWQLASAGTFMAVVAIGLVSLFGDQMRRLLGSSADALAGREVAFETAATMSPTPGLETEVDTQLKRVLKLRSEGKEKEAKTLLQQLKERYPNVDIHARLLQLETLQQR